MNFKQLLAKYVTGNITAEQLPELAVVALEEGFQSPSLYILVGLSKHESPYLIDHYFKLTLEELNIILTDKREGAIEYALTIVDEILAGEKEIISGSRELLYKAIDTYEFYSESKQYSYDSIGFEKAYGLFDTFEELNKADKPWQKEKTNEELMKEAKAELLEELRKWRDKMKSGEQL